MKKNEEKEEKQDGEVLDFNNPNFVFRPNEHHDWRQQGPYLVCKSCDLEHAIWVGMERMLVGLDKKGRPILKRKT
jgi:hypothetical protein